MIEKIISNGQPGVGRAALDAAMKLGIAHGGSISPGGMAEGALSSDPLDPREITAQSHPERTKNHIRESCGTLILTCGDALEQVEFIIKIATRFSKPNLHVDLKTLTAFTAATRVNDWIVDNDIKVLNVAGPGAPHNPALYQAALDLIQAVFFLNLTETNLSNPIQTQSMTGVAAGQPGSPQRIEDAVVLIQSQMSLKDRTIMANLREEELPPLQLTLGLYIKKRLDQWLLNHAFSTSCLAAAKDEGMDETNVAMLVIKKLWRSLRATHRLRVIK